MACLDRLFDVLRVAVNPTDNDQVLDAAGDIELAFAEEPKVTGSQEGAIAMFGHRMEYFSA